MNNSAAVGHYVALLITAELGAPGLLLWLWLMVGGLRACPIQAAPWAAMIVVGLFDTTLLLTSSWQIALIFALLAANVNHPVANPDDGTIYDPH